MAELVKQWNDGGSLSVSYDGDRDGSAVFSSDVNEGIDREMPVYFKGGGLSVERTVAQVGLREKFVAADGEFATAEGEIFGVLKGIAEFPYTYVEYIESTGKQYIDTGFKNNQDSRIVMDVQVVKQPSTNAWVFGGKNSTRVGARNVFLLNGKTWSVDYNSDDTRKSFPVGVLTRLNIDFDKNKVTINGTSHSFTAATFQCNYNHYLLAQNKIGEVGGYISARLYSCQIYDNNELVRDFVPVMVKDSGEYGLLDKVNNMFYGSSSNTQFIGG